MKSCLCRLWDHQWAAMARSKRQPVRASLIRRSHTCADYTPVIYTGLTNIRPTLPCLIHNQINQMPNHSPLDEWGSQVFENCCSCLGKHEIVGFHDQFPFDTLASLCQNSA